MSNRSELGRPSSGKRRLRDLLLQQDNKICADCSAPTPKWASANIGVFICLKCCSVHRSLGPDISKVLSVTLDNWSDEDIDAMIEVAGNASANSIYEAFIPEGHSKPSPDASHEARARFIRSKYELQEFVKPSLQMGSTSSQSSQKIDVNSHLANSSMDNSEGMIGSIGVLKVKVLKGTNLAVRDVLSSDPYVIIYLGHKSAQTTVMGSNLNPVWNEELTISIPQKFGTLKVQVYDQDTFSADDIMGEAEVDIQPLITSAMAYRDPRMFGDMQIGKWLKSEDNPLVDDSAINIVDGKVKQEMWLKLQNVESGELHLELEWISN